MNWTPMQMPLKKPIQINPTSEVIQDVQRRLPTHHYEENNHPYKAAHAVLLVLNHVQWIPVYYEVPNRQSDRRHAPHLPAAVDHERRDLNGHHDIRDERRHKIGCKDDSGLKSCLDIGHEKAEQNRRVEYIHQVLMHKPSSDPSPVLLFLA